MPQPLAAASPRSAAWRKELSKGCAAQPCTCFCLGPCPCPERCWDTFEGPLLLFLAPQLLELDCKALSGMGWWPQLGACRKRGPTSASQRSFWLSVGRSEDSWGITQGLRATLSTGTGLSEKGQLIKIQFITNSLPPDTVINTEHDGAHH